MSPTQTRMRIRLCYEDKILLILAIITTALVISCW